MTFAHLLACRPARDAGRSERVRRFRQEDFDDDDDEEGRGTYNGNSTQQQ